MAYRLDPEGRETSALLDVAELGGRRVLEIGCGDGRMMRRYAEQARSVVGIDPGADSVANAHRATSAEWRDRVVVTRADAACLPFRNDAFDVVMFGWSL